MTQCWLDDPAARPSFSDICINIDHIVVTAEHLPLPGQSHSPEQHAAAAAGPPPDQPSPSYSNCTFDSDDDDGAPLYRNSMNSSSLLGNSAVDD